MKSTTCFIVSMMAAVSFCQSQNFLVPGELSLDKTLVKNSRHEMSYFTVNGNSTTEIGSFITNIAVDNKTFSVYTSLQFLNSPDLWIDTSISDVNTLKPLYRSSVNKDNQYAIHYAKEISGYYFNRQTKKSNRIQEPVREAFFDNYAYPYLLGSLPLNAGYKKDLIVYDYKPGNNTNIKKARIEEVKNNIYTSNLTGEHKVWQVTVFEEASNDQYEYYIDKDSRRIWKITILAKGNKLLLIDKEQDYNPFTTTFDKEATLQLTKAGSSVITGQAFARDNQNEGLLKGMAILNINKKQFAKTGTTIILIPYTSFYKEWIQLNEASRKKGRSIPLPKEAAACIKVTTVYDNEGHFEFVNLMPGDYLLYTEFGYEHSSIHTEVVGYTDTYINGMFQGSTANTNTYSTNTNAGAVVKKIVTIKKEGDKVFAKLKKTL